MTPIAKLLDLAKPKARAQKGDTLTAADDPVAIETAMDDANEAMAAIRTELAALDGHRRELLLEDGTDAAIAAIDQKRAQALIQIDRLAALQPRLAARLREARAGVEKAAAASLRGRYALALDHFAGALTAAIDAREKLVALRQEACESGFGNRLDSLPLPSISLGLTYASNAQFHRGAYEVLSNWANESRTSQEVFTVRFTAPWPPYHAEEMAGFDATQAWRLVNAGVAVFVDPKRMPPEPASEKDKNS